MSASAHPDRPVIRTIQLPACISLLMANSYLRHENTAHLTPMMSPRWVPKKQSLCPDFPAEKPNRFRQKAAGAVSGVLES